MTAYNQRKVVGVEEVTYTELKKIAKANFRSMSGQIAFWVDQEEKEQS